MTSYIRLLGGGILLVAVYSLPDDHHGYHGYGAGNHDCQVMDDRLLKFAMVSGFQ